MATGTRTIRKGLHCCVPNDAFLNCPSLLQPQNRTAWEQLSRAGRKKGFRDEELHEVCSLSAFASY